ncbi:uncharacterized protein [Nicotiana tomentosiformis]|uniref:uncharacterized protein n=1 Tax=Nicotiana tomentosiformis TaxID=4098 RepID=UPI00388C4944
MTDEEQRILERFGRLQPPYFSGTELEDAQDFLDRWWEAYERRRPVDAAPLTWHEFSVLFLEKFMPQTRREKLCRQFEKLRQDGMSVTQNEMRFLELAHHAVLLVPTERERIRRWSDECEDIVQKLKTALTKAPVQVLPSASGSYTVYCGASRSGIGCVLISSESLTLVQTKGSKTATMVGAAKGL